MVPVSVMRPEADLHDIHFPGTAAAAAVADSGGRTSTQQEMVFHLLLPPFLQARTAFRTAANSAAGADDGSEAVMKAPIHT